MDLGGIVPLEKPAAAQWFWKAKGAKQGDMKNMTPQLKTKYSAYTKLYAVEWVLEAPYDEHTGQSTGSSFIKPIVLVKHVDQSSPLIAQALFSHEVISSSEFVFLDYPVAKAGQAIGQANAAEMKEIFTVTGTNGFIVSVEAGSTEDGRLLEKVSMMFNEVSWTSVVGATEAQYQRSAQQ